MPIHDDTDDDLVQQYRDSISRFMADAKPSCDLSDPNTTTSELADTLPDGFTLKAATHHRTASTVDSSAENSPENLYSVGSVGSWAHSSVADDNSDDQVEIMSQNPFGELLVRAKLVAKNIFEIEMSGTSQEIRLGGEDARRFLDDIMAECRDFFVRTESLKRNLGDSASGNFFESIKSSAPNDEVALSIWISARDTVSSMTPNSGDILTLQNQIEESISDKEKRESLMTKMEKRVFGLLRKRAKSYKSIDEQLTESEHQLLGENHAEIAIPTSIGEATNMAAK